MRHPSCMRHILVGLVLIAAVTPIAFAPPFWCYKVKPGAGAGGTQSGGECTGNCAKYIDCQESDACRRAYIGGRTCTLIPMSGVCYEYTRGFTLPGSTCCTAGTKRGRVAPTTIMIARLSGECAFGFDPWDWFGPAGYPRPGSGS